jgi:hypothetical protein
MLKQYLKKTAIMARQTQARKERFYLAICAIMDALKERILEDAAASLYRRHQYKTHPSWWNKKVFDLTKMAGESALMCLSSKGLMRVLAKADEERPTEEPKTWLTQRKFSFVCSQPSQAEHLTTRAYATSDVSTCRGPKFQSTFQHEPEKEERRLQQAKIKCSRLVNAL